jgi:hypothetical protein
MTQTQRKLALPHDTKVVVPLWDHCVLAVCIDPTGLVQDFYMVEWNRWGAEPVTRKVARGFAMRAFEQAYTEQPMVKLPDLGDSATASGEIG